MIIGLERSKNSIYDRIVLELARGFRSFGHECVIVDPSEIKSLADLYPLYGKCDWVIVTNNNALLSQKIGEAFLFEALPFKVVFLHHDALSHTSNDINEINQKVGALIRVKDRCIHFSIEKEDELALQSLGVACYPIAHINTLGFVTSNFDEEPAMDVSFIGHAIPPINGYIQFGFDDMNYFTSYQSRLKEFNHSLRNDFAKLYVSKHGERLFDSETLSSRIQYLLYANYYTMFLRGAVLQELNEWKIDLYGGDPAWMHGVEQTRNFVETHITNHKPVFAPQDVAKIFSISKVNLNITSLQFDTGLINRVIDCISAGGFILTDRKTQMFELTSCTDRITYSSIDELKDKIRYFTSPTHQSERKDLIKQMQKDFSANCSVERCVQQLLEKMF